MKMANIGMKTFCLLCVVHIYCVLGRQDIEFLFTTKKSSKIQNVTYILGSTVTFSCLNRWNNRTTWYRDSKTGDFAAYVDKGKNGCVLHNEKYPSISLGPCSDDYSGITFNSIQNTDSGIWWCAIDISNTLFESQFVNVEVKGNVAWTTSFPVPTSKTTDLVPTKPTTTPRVNTKRSGTTETTKLSSKQTGRIGLIGDSTTDEADSPSSRSYFIPLIAGACGVTVLIVMVVTIVVIKVRGRKYSQDGDGRQHNGSFNGGPAREEVNFEAECGGIGLEYAHISVTSGQPPARHDNGSKPQRNDEEDDELVMADNPIYMSNDQEENKTGNKSHTPAVSVYDKVPDVYSVVQKVRKSRADCSAQQKTDDQKPTESDDGMSDIYSLEKKTT